jgi:sulfur-carrier protein adenylyltransferase/sulfurtransferase
MGEKDQLTLEEMRRYSRQLILPGVGPAGQKKLKAARVLIVGLGGLGSPVALYLAAAGVGALGLVDFDLVDESNLQRQIIHAPGSVGLAKVESARIRLSETNPDVEIVAYPERFTSDRAMQIAASFDVIVDCSDNFPGRYLCNDVAVLLGKPLVYGSIFQFEGQASVFGLANGPCYRCVFPNPPPPHTVPTCSEGGVLCVLPGLIGLIQATETVKLILAMGEPLSGTLLLYDALSMSFERIRIKKNPHCAICSPERTITKLLDDATLCCGKSDASVEDGADASWEVQPSRLAEELAQMNSPSPTRLIDVREPEEWELVHLPGAELIPLAALPGRMAELSPEENLVLYCKKDWRAQEALYFLRANGYRKVRRLNGGLDAWAAEVDPSLPAYW